MKKSLLVLSPDIFNVHRGTTNRTYTRTKAYRREERLQHAALPYSKSIVAVASKRMAKAVAYTGGAATMIAGAATVAAVASGGSVTVAAARLAPVVVDGAAIAASAEAAVAAGFRSEL